MLEVSGISVFYGAAQALFDVSLTVAPGEIAALMGRNGMGKTTTIRAIAGLTPARGGAIRIRGIETGRLAPHRIARLGLGLVPEGRRCFPNLTVRENLIATARSGARSGARGAAWGVDRVVELFPRLGEYAGRAALTLSGGEQQMLAIGRALTTNPGLLILDEATEGLAPAVRGEIRAAIRVLKGEGIALLIVDKSFGDLWPDVTRCTILERGRSVWSGPPADLTPELSLRHLGVG